MTKAKEGFHSERLDQAPLPPWPARLAARGFCHVLVGALRAATSLFRRLRRHPDSRSGSRQCQGARVVLTGTFFADSWVEAHVRPIAMSHRIDRVWVVSDRRFLSMKNVQYVCPPRWLKKLIGRVAARSLIFTAIAILKRADVVGGFHLLGNGLLALMVARLIGARAMYYCVGGWAEFVGGGVRTETRVFTLIGREDQALERKLLDSINQFDLILTMGTGAKAFLEDRKVKAPIEVMPGGIDMDAYAPSNGQHKKFDIVTVSRIAPVKRIDVLLHVVRRIADQLPDVSVAVVGDGDLLDTLRQQAAELGIANNVEFVGRQKNIPRWLSESRVFVLTSDSEGLSLALMEAMMAGLPAVVSDVGDLGDLVTDGVNGWRPQPRDVEAFANRISALLTDATSYAAFAGEARRAAEPLSVDATVARWEMILAEWGFSNVHESTLVASRRQG